VRRFLSNYFDLLFKLAPTRTPWGWPLDPLGGLGLRGCKALPLIGIETRTPDPNRSTAIKFVNVPFYIVDWRMVVVVKAVILSKLRPKYCRSLFLDTGVYM